MTAVAVILSSNIPTGMNVAPQITNQDAMRRIVDHDADLIGAASQHLYGIDLALYGKRGDYVGTIRAARPEPVLGPYAPTVFVDRTLPQHKTVGWIGADCVYPRPAGPAFIREQRAGRGDSSLLPNSRTLIEHTVNTTQHRTRGPLHDQ